MGEQATVTLDRCPWNHGLWFDPGEMETIIRSFSDGNPGIVARFFYSYDDEGRRVGREDRVTGELTTYEYNVLEQMVGLEEGGVSWAFVYDANDLRVLVAAEDAGLLVVGHGAEVEGTVFPE